MNFFSLFKRKIIYQLRKKIKIDNVDININNLDKLFNFYGSDKAEIFKENNYFNKKSKFKQSNYNNTNNNNKIKPGKSHGILFSINTLFGLVFIISWVLVFSLFRYSSLSSIIGSLSIPVYLLITNQTNNAIFFGIIFILIFFTHRENIKRLKNKEESKTKIY